MSLFLSLFFASLLLCSFFRLKELFKSEKWFNYLVTFFLLLENAKNLDILNSASKILQKFEWLDEAKRKKKRERMPQV